MSYEEPDYTVIYKDGNFEYREYSSYLIAETVIENVDDYKKAGNEGFRRLFRYITGNNRSQSEISMTVPVQQTPTSEKISMTVPVQQADSAEGWSLSFTLPSAYTMDTAPMPADSRIRIREVPGRTMAVLRYSGRWTESNFVEQKSTLQEQLAIHGIDTFGEVQSAVYNGPYTPPFLRRNEVMIEVDRVPESEKTTPNERLAASGGY